jgi:CheY-like chemotaxis protein
MAEKEKLLHSAPVYIVQRNRIPVETLPRCRLKHEISNQQMRALLHVEDDEPPAVAFRGPLDEANVQVAVDGQQALEYLRGEGRYAGIEPPKAVFLDVNPPRADGWRVLVAMSQNEQFRLIPVVVLSTCSRDCDKQLAYALRVKHYISKPDSLEQLIADVTEGYWQLTCMPGSQNCGRLSRMMQHLLCIGRSVARKNTGGAVSRPRLGCFRAGGLLRNRFKTAAEVQ